MFPFIRGCPDMEKAYVTKINDGYRLTGTRVSLDSVVFDFLSGLSPESIVENFDTLTLEQVYGAITYYLANKEEVESSLDRGHAKFEALREQARAANPLLYKKLEEGIRERRLQMESQEVGS
jgi:hypothetical protein